MNTNKRILVILVIMLLVSLPMLAQIDVPGEGGEEGPVDAAPIDGLIGIGLLIGTYFGAKKLRK